MCRYVVRYYSLDVVLLPGTHEGKLNMSDTRKPCLYVKAVQIMFLLYRLGTDLIHVKASYSCNRHPYPTTTERAPYIYNRRHNMEDEDEIQVSEL